MRSAHYMCFVVVSGAHKSYCVFGYWYCLRVACTVSRSGLSGSDGVYEYVSRPTKDETQKRYKQCKGM